MGLRKPLEISLRLALAAIIVGAGVAPPPVCHAHEGGDHSVHSHRSVDPFHDADHDSRDARLSKAMALGATGVGVDSLATHHHYQLFGFEFHLPCDGDNCDEDENSEFVAIRSVQNASAIFAGINGQHGIYLCAVPEPGVQPIVVATSAIGSHRVVTSPPLCDSARLERSGVRLA